MIKVKPKKAKKNKKEMIQIQKKAKTSMKKRTKKSEVT